jgi:hypothetical protein
MAHRVRVGELSIDEGRRLLSIVVVVMVLQWRRAQR